jgi:ABC-type uncharacterized transport system ATPase subunit
MATSVLPPQEADELFVTLRRLAAEGCSILFISHQLGEVRALFHSATVLRSSRVAGAYLSLAYTPMWAENMSAGRGWIAWRWWCLPVGGCAIPGATAHQPTILR